MSAVVGERYLNLCDRWISSWNPTTADGKMSEEALGALRVRIGEFENKLVATTKIIGISILTELSRKFELLERIAMQSERKFVKDPKLSNQRIENEYICDLIRQIRRVIKEKIIEVNPDFGFLNKFEVSKKDLEKPDDLAELFNQNKIQSFSYSNVKKALKTCGKSVKCLHLGEILENVDMSTKPPIHKILRSVHRLCPILKALYLKNMPDINKESLNLLFKEAQRKKGEVVRECLKWKSLETLEVTGCKNISRFELKLFKEYSPNLRYIVGYSGTPLNRNEAYLYGIKMIN